MRWDTRLSANEQAGRRPGRHGQGDRSSPRAFRLRVWVRCGWARRRGPTGRCRSRAGTRRRRIRRSSGCAITPASFPWWRWMPPTTRCRPSRPRRCGRRGPGRFTFNVKAFSLYTRHPTPVAALPVDLRPAAEKTGKDRVYFHDLGPAVADEAWQRFSAALEPLRAAGKLGAILLQFPPWFPISRARKDYIVACAGRAAPDRVCVEFRNQTWMTPDNQDETLGFLTEHRLPYVCVDMPQGHRDSIPPVLAATSPDLAVVRMHGHSGKWNSKDIHERFGYRYTKA